MSYTKIIAHRGASAYAPENTMPAFEMALGMGADGLELDVHLTRDGHLVVAHDEWLNRTSDGRGLIRDMSLEELRRLDFGSWFGSAFRGVQIPLLEEVLDLIRHWEGMLNIEIKEGYHFYPGIEEELVGCLRKHQCEEKIIFSSFNHDSMARIKVLNPDLKIGLLYSARLYQPWRYAQSFHAEALHPAYYTVDEAVVKGCKEHGVWLHPWTIDDEGEMRRQFSLGVEGVITNRPDVALKVRESYSSAFTK